MIYLVLGMHKSGTTLAAEILHKSGIAMGAECDAGGDYETGNKYERQATQELNKELLQCHQMDSLDIKPPANLTMDDAVCRRMIALIQREQASGADWGFKDPRTCLTYSLWQACLPEHRLIVVYRHPVQVYLHYRHKTSAGKFQKVLLTWKILRVWTLYNQQILAFLRQAPADAYLLLNYEHLMGTPQEFERLATFVERPLVDARKPSHFKRSTQTSTFVTFADCTLRLSGATSPLQLFQELERLRTRQIQTHEHSDH